MFRINAHRVQTDHLPATENDYDRSTYCLCDRGTFYLNAIINSDSRVMFLVTGDFYDFKSNLQV
jgi:hypothetical protein